MQATARSSLHHQTTRTVRAAARRREWLALLIRLVPLLVIAASLWSMAALQWLILRQVVTPDPVFFTALAAAFSVFIGFRFRSLRRSVTEALQQASRKPDLSDLVCRLRGLGYRVVHNLPADGGDIDHVVIGRHGIYVIGTVIRSLPVKGSRRAFFDGQAISVGDNAADDTAVLRIKAQARQLRRLLQRIADNDYGVRPILLMPGWQLESVESGSFDEVWVLAPRDLPMWIGNQPESVHGRDVKQIADALTDYLRRFH